MAKRKRSNIIKFFNPATDHSTGGPVTQSLILPGKPDKPSDLVNLVCLLPQDPLEAARVAACNWASFKGFRWDNKPTANSTHWALFPIDYDGADMVRASNWEALQDTLSAHVQVHARFLRFKHPDTSCLRVLAIQVGYDPQSVTPAFRLFMGCLKDLQQNKVIDEEMYSELWQDSLAEKIRIMGALYADPALPDTTGMTSGTVKTGWPLTVVRYLMDKQPQLLVSAPGTLPELKEHDILLAMQETNVLARELVHNDPYGGLLVEM